MSPCPYICVVLLALIGAPAPVRAQPQPPEAPTITRPTVKHPEVAGVPYDDSTLVAVILRLDSLRAEMRAHIAAVRRLEAQSDSARAVTLPAGSNRRTYLPDEVDTPPRVLRRHAAAPEDPPFDIFVAKHIVTPDGTVRETRIISGPETRRPEAETALQEWLFVPAVRKGRRVTVRHTTEVRLGLRP